MAYHEIHHSEIIIKSSNHTATFCFLFVGVLISLLIPQLSSAEAQNGTSFFLHTKNTTKREHCDSIKINSNTLACNYKTLTITYPLDAINKLEVINKNGRYVINSFDQETIREINSINNNGVNDKIETETDNIPNAQYTDIDRDVLTGLDRVAQQYPKAFLVISICSMLLILIGYIWMLITSFHTSIAWGLLCLLPPVGYIGMIITSFHNSISWRLLYLLSLVGVLLFPIIHWKKALIPFLLMVIGIVIAIVLNIYFPSHLHFYIQTPYFYIQTP